MRTRGNAYWEWADPTLHCRTHEEELSDGATIDVQVRLSRAGVTQLFIGVYACGGMVLYEEGIDCRSNESMTRALAWGVGKARHIAEQGLPQAPMRSRKA
ncbi:hypothetical protein [Pseudomonas sp. Hg5Tf]|uniref:Uncharacterized protein n=1 Tax=Pseudomonas sp. Hg7Tf TaxID=3236988 RepID=A0AB39I7P8_9PSED|nr:hypothetical protein [Pseudomonas sp. Hg5Tf]MDH2558353.1 hypothetical protein [Pseudomonas sp. Hg5Tf]